MNIQELQNKVNAIAKQNDFDTATITVNSSTYGKPTFYFGLGKTGKDTVSANGHHLLETIKELQRKAKDSKNLHNIKDEQLIVG